MEDRKDNKEATWVIKKIFDCCEKPTRAEVADVSEAVRKQADALMLSGESAMGMYPEKALAVLGSVSLRIERQCREEMLRETLELPSISSSLSDDIKEEISFSAAKMA